jgi:sulfur carrier protein ThiS
MRVQLKLMGVLKSKMPADASVEVAEGATIVDVLRALEIDPESVQVFSVNGKLERDRERTLAENDELSVIPPVGGG